MKKFKIRTIFTGMFIFVTITLMISLADLFSSLITVGGFTFTSDNLNISHYTLYAVSISSTDNKVIANEQAETCKKQGGAGYIYMNNVSYNVIASIYESKADAENVKSNIINTKPNTSILEITIPSITIHGNLTSKEREIIIDSLEIYKNSYKKLYDISVSLDTSIITEINAKLNVNELYSQINTIYNNFDTIFTNTSSNTFKEVKNQLQNLQSIITRLINSNDTLPYTANIKNAYCEIMFLYKDLADKF